MGNLQGKTALVTGAGRGMGRAIAERIAKEGARVGVHYGSSAQGARETVQRIEDEGGQAFLVHALLGTAEDASTLWERFDVEAEHVDILVNNAGILGSPAPFAEIRRDSFSEVFAVNTAAPFFIAQQALPRMRDGGRIINISTSFTHGSRNPKLIPYAMSKAAVDALTSGLAVELGPRGITVNAVGPGATATDMNAHRLATEAGRQQLARRSPLNKVAQPEDIADVVAFLAGPDARWVTGQWIDATGGALL